MEEKDKDELFVPPPQARVSQVFFYVKVIFIKVHRILLVALYFVFGNQNKRFVYWRAGLDIKQEVNVNKCILFMKQPSLFLEG